MDIKFEHEVNSPKYKKWVREIIIWVVEIILVVALANVLVNQGMVKTKMMGDSMEPTLKNTDQLIINKWFYRIHKPDRFDVVAYTQNGEEHSYLTIKRIIGLPGETIQISKGKVYVNDVELEERNEVEEVLSAGLASEPLTLDENEYFVLGDNRNNSEDSRFANVGNIIESDIIGKVWIRTNSFSFVDSLNHKQKETQSNEE